MSDIHILEGDGNDKWTIVIHVSITSANNSVVVNWHTAAVNSELYGQTRLPDGDGTKGTISAAEKAEIEAGEVVEHAFTMDVEGAGCDSASRTAAIRAQADSEKTDVLAMFEKRLDFFGATLTWE